MKKFLLSMICVISLVGVANAQNKLQKSADFIQVAKGDWSLGVSGQVFNRNEVVLQTGLYAKYFITDNIALRGNVRFGRDWAKGEDPEYVYDSSEDWDDYSRVLEEGDEIVNTIRTSSFMLVVGAEQRHKLCNRMVGYYGLDMGIGGYGQFFREKKNGVLISQGNYNRSVDVAFQPFIGFEYFLASRISLAAEFGYDVLFKFYSADKYKEQEHSGSSNYETEKYPQYNKIASHIDLGNCTFAALKLAYYF